MATDNPHGACGQGNCCNPASAWAIKPSAGIANKEDGQKAGQGSPQTCLPFTYAKPIKCNDGCPQLQRRLEKIFVVVVTRTDPVATHQHFTGNLSVPAFVGWNQVTVIEATKPHEGIQRPHDQNPNWS